MGNGSGDTQFKVLAKVTELDERLTKVEGRMIRVEDRLIGVEDRLIKVEERLAGVEVAMDDMVPAVKQILATQNLLIEGFQHFGDHERRIQVLERIAQIRK